MALNASQRWWIRTDGDNTNGGGYDSEATGAVSTNYSDQAVAQLSLTDLATPGAGSTTLTSATGGFTDAMRKNIIRISTTINNFTAGYYRVDTFVSSNEVTLDRTPTSGGAGSGGSGKLGGAFALLEPLMGSGVNGLGTPPITSPLAAGHIINCRGLGSNDPSIVDYDYKGTTNAGFYNGVASGTRAIGKIKLVGYNGRPLLQTSGLLIHHDSGVILWHVENIKIKLMAGANYDNYGFVRGPSTGESGISYKNVIVDANGNDAILLGCQVALDCEIRNSGGGVAGTKGAIVFNDFGGTIQGNVITGVRGYGIRSSGLIVSFHGTGVIANNIISGVLAGGINFDLNSVTYGICILNNTINNCVDGITLQNSSDIAGAVILNNIISNNTGVGLKCAVGTTPVNDRLTTGRFNYNNFYNNGTARSNISAGPNDMALDPQYTNAAALDFSVGENMKAIGFPGAFRGTTTTGYMDLGAAQRQEAGGGGGGLSQSLHPIESGIAL
jgi:hypothetical protein